MTTYCYQNFESRYFIIQHIVTLPEYGHGAQDTLSSLIFARLNFRDFGDLKKFAKLKPCE